MLLKTLNVTVRFFVYLPTPGGWLAAALIGLAAMVAPQTAQAQVVVVVNGIPITAIDIEQRIKLDTIMVGKPPTRQQVISELVDDKIKLTVAKRSYDFEVGQSDVDESFAKMASRARMNPAQLTQMLAARGSSVSAFKDKIRADMTWQQLVRGRFPSSLQVGETDINTALQGRSDENSTVGYTYTLYPVIMIIGSGASEGIIEGRRREAENLRARFQNCAEGLKLARALRDVAVREPISRSSVDLPAPLRELLGKLELGHLTTPEVTAQGLQMFALCEKKQSGSDSPAKREVRDEIFAKRFDAESKKWLDDARRQAMIEYR
jgi:peptidyl-prolyl cis-trans isomerase SurA